MERPEVTQRIAEVWFTAALQGKERQHRSLPEKPSLALLSHGVLTELNKRGLPIKEKPLHRKPTKPGSDRIAQFRSAAFGLDKKKEVTYFRTTISLTILDLENQQWGNEPVFLRQRGLISVTVWGDRGLWTLWYGPYYNDTWWWTSHTHPPSAASFKSLLQTLAFGYHRHTASPRKQSRTSSQWANTEFKADIGIKCIDQDSYSLDNGHSVLF